VTQRGGRSCLSEESLEDFLIADLVSNDFDRDLAAQLGIATEVDSGHASGAKLAEDLEASDV
jgi:hypothetical protein